MDKTAGVLTAKHQEQWSGNQWFDKSILNDIDPSAQLHSEIINPRSSAAACINTIGNIARNKQDLLNFLNQFDLGVEVIIPFPMGATYEGETYNDSGNVVFEWIGPKVSPINERAGKRGQNRTSIDAYILTTINGKITQLLIEWKFTETYNGGTQLQKFAGTSGIERLRRYSSYLVKLRKRPDFPFQMSEEGGFGLQDLGYEPYFQLLRMTLLAKATTPFQFDSGPKVEDYRIVHLSHSQNDRLNTLSRKHVSCTPGLKEHCGRLLHEAWSECILSESEALKFRHGYWDQAISCISNGELKKYLIKRYV